MVSVKDLPALVKRRETEDKPFFDEFDVSFNSFPYNFTIYGNLHSARSCFKNNNHSRVPREKKTRVYEIAVKLKLQYSD